MCLLNRIYILGGGEKLSDKFTVTVQMAWARAGSRAGGRSVSAENVHHRRGRGGFRGRNWGNITHLHGKSWEDSRRHGNPVRAYSAIAPPNLAISTISREYEQIDMQSNAGVSAAHPISTKPIRALLRD